MKEVTWKEISLTTRAAGLIRDGLDSLAVELSAREERAEDFELVEWLAEYLEENFEI